MTTSSEFARQSILKRDATPATPVDRQRLHRLVDELPEGELAEAGYRLDALLAKDDPQGPGLIAQWIRPHPHKGGAADVVIAESNVPVYALIGELSVVAGDLDQAAADYEVPREAVEAALAYYRRHRDLIDDRMFTGRPALG